MKRLGWRLSPLLLASAILLASTATHKYRAVTIDSAGQLHIAADSGAEILAPKILAQLGFDSPLISSDGVTVGWLATYPYPGDADPAADPIAGTLVLYRAGRVLQTFSTEQIFWGWKFLNDSQVAYCTGPTHGGAAECLLRDATSGRKLAQWLVDQDTEPPTWVKDMHY